MQRVFRFRKTLTPEKLECNDNHIPILYDPMIHFIFHFHLYFFFNGIHLVRRCFLSLELAQLSGIAAILRFPLPELEEEELYDSEIQPTS